MNNAVLKIDYAIEHLKTARDFLKRAGAPKTLARVRLALTSAGGARRHALNAEARGARQGREK